MNHRSYDASPYSSLSETTVCSDVHSVKPCPLGLDSQTMRSLWRQGMATNSLKDPLNDNASTARGELAALHEMVGSLAAMLYQLSTSLNGLSGSNQLIYTAYTLRLWILRWWALIQHEAERQINAMQPGQRSQLATHQHGCACMYCQDMEAAAATLLLGKVVPYLTSSEYTPDMGVAKLDFGVERSKEESKSSRLLFEPRHAAWQSSDPFTFTKESERSFDKNLQISSACLRKELHHLATDIATMESVNGRPSFQSFRLALKAVYDAFPVAQRGCDQKGCLSWAQRSKKTRTQDIEAAVTAIHSALQSSGSLPTMVEEAHQQRARARARQLHDLFACCRKHLDFINITGLEEVRYAQNQSIRQQQTEGVTSGLILATSAQSMSMVYSMDPLSPKQDRLIYATVLLYLCAVLLSLWSSLLLLCSCLRLSHPGSRTLVRRDGRVCPIFQLLYSATLTRMVQALAIFMLKFAFAATVMVYHQSWLLQPTGVEYQPDLMANYRRGDPHGTSVPIAIFMLAMVHLCARAQWRYLWEGAYGWRAWRRYRAAVDGNDTEEENKLRECNVLVEVAYHCVRDRGLSLHFGWLKGRSVRAGRLDKK